MSSFVQAHGVSRLRWIQKNFFWRVICKICMKFLKKLERGQYIKYTQIFEKLQLFFLKENWDLMRAAGPTIRCLVLSLILMQLRMYGQLIGLGILLSPMCSRFDLQLVLPCKQWFFFLCIHIFFFSYWFQSLVGWVFGHLKNKKKYASYKPRQLYGPRPKSEKPNGSKPEAITHVILYQVILYKYIKKRYKNTIIIIIKQC